MRRVAVLGVQADETLQVGVAAIPPTEFMTDDKAHIVENYMRFAVCKDDEVLETAKERLRGLKQYIQD